MVVNRYLRWPIRVYERTQRTHEKMQATQSDLNNFKLKISVCKHL